MQLKETASVILNQLFDLTNQLNDTEYKAELELLNGNSIGKHVRHVVEFFDLLISGSAFGLINYDKRNHNSLYETNTKATKDKLQLLIKEIDQIAIGKEIFLEVSYGASNETAVKVKSSQERELAYNIEHAIHHMAIIKIAVQTVFPKVKLAENFGVAFSTIRYQQSLNG